MRLDLPSSAALTDVHTIGLPADWRSNQLATRAVAMSCLAGGRSLGLWVPSFVEPSDQNLLPNPTHPQYKAIKLTVERNPVRFDPQLF